MLITPIKEPKEINRLLQIIDTGRMRYQEITGDELPLEKFHTALMRTVPQAFSDH